MILSGSADGRAPSWRSHLEKPSGHSAAEDVSIEDLYQSMLDDVQYYPTSTIKKKINVCFSPGVANICAGGVPSGAVFELS